MTRSAPVHHRSPRPPPRRMQLPGEQPHRPGRPGSDRRSATPGQLDRRRPRPSPDRRAAAHGPASARTRPTEPAPGKPAAERVGERACGRQVGTASLRRRSQGRAGGPGRRTKGRSRTAGQGRRSLHDLRARARRCHPHRPSRGAHPRRALRLAGLGRHHPDRRQHLPRPGAERPPRHGSGLHRHRDPEERRPLPRRCPLRHRRRRAGNPRDSPGSSNCSARDRPSSARSRRTRSARKAPA